MTDASLNSLREPSDEEILRELKSASTDLTYPSESDEPFDVFCWKATEQDALKQILTGHKAGAKAFETSVDDFFSELIAGDDGNKFQGLRSLIESLLAELRVLRIGEIEVDVYVVGRTPTKNWAGLHTISVET